MPCSTKGHDCGSQGKEQNQVSDGPGWVCVLSSAPWKPGPSSSSPKGAVPKALREQVRRLLAFSWSWGSLSHLTVGLIPACTGTICSSTMPPVPAVPSPSVVPPRSKQSQQAKHIKNLM